MSATATLDNAVALVVGASGGIGRAIAFDLLAAGAEVFMQGRSMENLVQKLPPANACGQSHFVVADLTEAGAVEAIAAAVAPKGRLDVLIMSSGIYERSHDPVVFARQIASNLIGPYALVQKLLPMLIESKGQVVFINSTQGLKAAPGIGQYAATKHAMKAIADSLRDEVNAEGVRVMSIFLGRTATEMQRGIFASEGRPYPPERLIQSTDVAELVLSLVRLPPTCEATDIVLRPMQKT
jgi:NAD(P)-dependent dehydrogenase (short-subunit alcohol dehydrogenase family)